MKKYFILSVLLLVSGFFASCNYLNIDDYFEDTFQEDSIYANKRNIERYFNGAAALLPVVDKIWEYGNTPGVTGSDEAVSCGDWNGMVVIQFSGTKLMNNEITSSSMGGWTWDFNIWPKCYKVIRKVNTILPHIDGVRDMNSFERMEFRAKCRFLRAYAYYLILQQNGPMILLGDEIVSNNEEAEYYARTRNTYDECVEYITSEMVLAAKDLPLERGANNIARPTRGAALATRAKVLLYAASPLMNGNTDSYAQQMVDDEGNRLLSAEYDESKWARAAAAARDVMELPGNNNGHRYQLYVKNRIRGGGTDDYPETIEPFDDNNFSKKSWPDGYADIDPFESYRSVFNGELSAYANPELIFSRVDNITVDHSGEGTNSPDGIANMVLHQLPTVAGGWSMHGMTQKQCDSYYMADGTDCPGKDKEIGRGDGSARLSGYVTSEDVDAGRYKPLRAGVSLQYANREPRFYASVAFNGSVWNMSSLNGKDGAASPNQQVWYYRGTSEGYNGGNRIFTGIGIKKYVNPYDAKYQNSFYYRQKTETAIRYAEILLIYAEALNELDGSYDIPSWDGSAMYTLRRDVNELKKGIQPVRIRAGVPDYTSSEYQNKEMFRKKLKRERQIEFMGENHRYYDLRRWKDAPQEEETLIYGCNMLMDEARRDLFHTPVAIMSLPVRFVEKSYFWPFSHGQLQRNKRLTQNPGWTYYD